MHALRKLLQVFFRVMVREELGGGFTEGSFCRLTPVQNRFSKQLTDCACGWPVAQATPNNETTVFAFPESV